MRKSLPTALLLLALAPPCAAAPSHSFPLGGVWADAWAWLTSWMSPALPPGPTTDAGCEIDPNGRCK